MQLSEPIRYGSQEPPNQRARLPEAQTAARICREVENGYGLHTNKQSRRQRQSRLIFNNPYQQHQEMPGTNQKKSFLKFKDSNNYSVTEEV